MDESKRESAAMVMRQINQAWLDGRVEDLAPMVHSEIVMVFPNFAGKVQGRENLLAGFDDFRRNAVIQGISGARSSKWMPPAARL